MLDSFRNLFAPPRDLILVVAAIWIGLWLSEKRSAKHGIHVNDLNNIAFFPLLGYILGGRILFMIENFNAFAKDPLGLVSLNLDLFDPFGGLAVALIVAFVYGQRRQLPFWSTLDALTPLFAFFAVGLGLAHVASGNAFGKETTVPWGIELWGATRHPSQFYETAAALLIFGLLWVKRIDSPPGVYFLVFAALTSGARLFLEAFRGDSALVLGGLRLPQILAWLGLGIALFSLDRRMRKPSGEMSTRSS